jgi:hypothetical protein
MDMVRNIAIKWFLYYVLMYNSKKGKAKVRKDEEIRNYVACKRSHNTIVAPDSFG